ncbi:MAG: hypothetical protein U9Q15_00875 [Patescibacteria group bacterium]|nr:hypothetical protein [Patescibacteria group bacterium]
MSGFWDLNNNSGGLILQRGSGSVHTLSGYMYSEDFGWASADGPNHTSQIAEYRMDYDGSEKVIGCFEGEMFSENGGFVQLNPSQVTACTE